MTKNDAARLCRLDNQDPRIITFHYLFTHFGSVFDVYVWLVVTERVVVLVDTLTNPRALQSVMAYAKDYLATRQLLVVNTHADYDHAWGNQLFVGDSARWPAPVIGTTQCAERLRAQETRDLLRTLQAQNNHTFSGVIPTPPTILFDDRLTIDGGDLTLQLIATPGHTCDHASVFIPELGLLIAGDAAETPVPSIYGDVAAFQSSLQRMLRLDPADVQYSHLDPGTGLRAITQNVVYLQRLETCCRAALAKGDPLAVELDNLETAVAFPFESAVDGTVPVSNTAFYRTAHRQAIRAMLEHLAAQSLNCE